MVPASEIYTMEISQFGKEYLFLGHRMGKVIDKYVDAYFGPQELQQIVNIESKSSVKTLLQQCIQLQSQLLDQGFTQAREKYLKKILLSMETSLRIKKGEKIPYKEQIRNLFDIEPVYVSDEKLSKDVENLYSVYEGSGPLSDRIVPVYKRRELPKSKLYKSYKKGIKIVRERTYELFPNLLPASETVEIKEVLNEKWALYNWYEGGFRSRIDIDITKPISWNSILNLSAHEGYPGHHTESCVKDKFLYQEQGRFENCILLIQTPQMAIYEGIGNSALDVLFSEEVQAKLSLDTFCPDPSEENLEKLIEEKIAWQGMRGYDTNIAMHIYNDNWTDDEVVDHILGLGFTTEDRVRDSLKFIRDPLWRNYSFNYYVGERLIKEKYGEHPTAKDFEYLLKNPILPSDLV